MKLLERRLLPQGDGRKLDQNEFEFELTKITQMPMRRELRRSFKTFVERSLPREVGE